MRRTMHKWFYAWSFEKEEKWLNEMAAKGLALVAIGFCKYTFEDCTPGEYNVRLELLKNVPAHAESQQYIRFLEETGAEYLGTIARWVYFRKKTTDGEFNLYSDNPSRIQHLNRILNVIGAVGGLNICIGFANLALYLGNGHAVSIIPAILPLSLGLVFAYEFLKIFLKKCKLRKQQNLFE